jgi:hypothetical protein
VLRVPGVVVPTEFNYVMNPAHVAMKDAKLGPSFAFPFDKRLLPPVLP